MGENGEITLIKKDIINLKNELDTTINDINNAIKEIAESFAVAVVTDPKKAAKKTAKIALNSYDAVKDLIPASERACVIKNILKDKLIKWSIPQILIFVGYVLTILLTA